MTQLFLDTADPGEVKRWLSRGTIDGVTTNPTIMRRLGVRDVRATVEALLQVAEGLPVSVALASDDETEIDRQARELVKWGDNLVVKVPIINSSGQSMLRVIHELANSGIRVNATACLSFGQAMLAAKAGAAYVSLLAGRVEDYGADSSPCIRSLAAWLTSSGLGAQLIVASIRVPYDVQTAVLAGAHIVTVPPAILEKFAHTEGSRVAAKQFLDDGLLLMRDEIASAPAEVSAVAGNRR